MGSHRLHSEQFNTKMYLKGLARWGQPLIRSVLFCAFCSRHCLPRLSYTNAFFHPDWAICLKPGGRNRRCHGNGVRHNLFLLHLLLSEQPWYPLCWPLSPHCIHNSPAIVSLRLFWGPFPSCLRAEKELFPFGLVPTRPSSRLLSFGGSPLHGALPEQPSGSAANIGSCYRDQRGSPLLSVSYLHELFKELLLQLKLVAIWTIHSSSQMKRETFRVGRRNSNRRTTEHRTNGANKINSETIGNEMFLLISNFFF